MSDLSSVFVGLDIETRLSGLIGEHFRDDPEVFKQPNLPPDPADSPPKPRADWKPETNDKKFREWQDNLPALREAWEQQCLQTAEAHEPVIQKEGALNPVLSEIVCVALWAPPQPSLPDGLETVFSIRTHEALLGAVWNRVMPGDNGMTIVGHNVRGFDLKQMFLRGWLTGEVTPAKQQALQAYYDPWKPGYLNDHVIDTMDRLPYKLEMLSKIILNEPKDPISDQVWKLVAEGNIQRVEQGCLQHARLEFQIAQKIGLVPTF